jgi:uncharacterized OB-fold protein
MPNIVQFPISPICPKCRRPVQEVARVTDSKGKVMHEECYRLEVKERVFAARFFGDSG